MSSKYEGRDEACPVSTEGKGGGGGGTTGANTTMIGAAVYCVARWFPGQGPGRTRGLYAGRLAGVDAGAGAVAPVGHPPPPSLPY